MKSDFVCLDWGGSDITGFCTGNNLMQKSFKIAGGNLRILKTEQLDEICLQLIRQLEAVTLKSTVWLIGAAGADDTEASKRLMNSLRLVAPESEICIFSDYVCNHAACLDGQDGILSVNGTGSILYAVSGDNRQRASGWGYLFDELPSGAYFGRKALEGVLRYIEGDSAYSCFAESYRERHGKPDRTGIIDNIYRNTSIQRQLGSYAPVLTDAFSAGCRMAERIIGRSVASLAETAGRLIDCRDEAVAFCGSGGLWKHWPALIRLVENEFNRQKLNFTFTLPRRPLQLGPMIHLARQKPEFKNLLETLINQETFNVSRSE